MLDPNKQTTSEKIRALKQRARENLSIFDQRNPDFLKRKMNRNIETNA